MHLAHVLRALEPRDALARHGARLGRVAPSMSSKVQARPAERRWSARARAREQRAQARERRGATPQLCVVTALLRSRACARGRVTTRGASVRLARAARAGVGRRRRRRARAREALGVLPRLEPAGRPRCSARRTRRRARDAQLVVHRQRASSPACRRAASCRRSGPPPASRRARRGAGPTAVTIRARAGQPRRARARGLAARGTQARRGGEASSASSRSMLAARSRGSSDPSTSSRSSSSSRAARGENAKLLADRPACQDVSATWTERSASRSASARSRRTTS